MRKNIPEETTSFVGRVGELARVRDALGRRRLVTLVGGAGVGKSRLALRAASARTPEADGGIYWADLWPLPGDELLAATVADALGLSDHTSRMPLDALCAWVAERPVLLILDSCEHLVPQCRHLIERLLADCPRMRVLTTSREALGVAAETVLTVPPLETATDAVTLFAQRAEAVGAPVRDDAQQRLAAGLCARLEGVPLALELAAAQLRHHGLAEITTRVRSGLDLPHAPRTAAGAPTPPPPDVPAPGRPARHGAVRTAVGWSHELCRPTERLLWARLAAFPGGFDAAFAEQVCAGGPLHPEELRSCLAGLVNKSVVTRGGDGRHRLLDTIREYGRMWLRELGEEEHLAARHARVVLELSRLARDEWLSSRQQSWYARLEGLYHDIREALRYLLGADPDAALELAGNVAFFWVCCGHLYETDHFLQLALAATGRPGPRRTRGLWSLGLAHVLQGDHATGRKYAALSRESARAGDDAEGVRQAAYLDGLAALLTGHPLAALAGADEALRGATAGEASGFGTTLCRLVRVFAFTGAGRLKEARETAETLRRACVRTGEFWTRSYTDYQLALVALFEGRADEATTHARDMLDAKRRLGDRFGIALGLELLAASWAERGAPRHAALAYGASAQHWEIVGHHQRGTPEVAPLRERGQAAARTRLGPTEYAALFERALLADRDHVVTWATTPEPAPHL
ncbi:regulator [Streptomyces tubbatahanensis]|uniref:Regulator n=1 Tax=Streptomyces tubbatahanensis TaxID=2923272 RepID=A0ABY3XTY7_9ACTN|nr:regulator [Streptomyces tubbatahanensis]UNS97942.1 regulator [Streptomyces tubbatahanensis]